MAFIAPDEALGAFHNYCYVSRKRMAVFFTIYNNVAWRSPWSNVLCTELSVLGLRQKTRKNTFIRRFFFVLFNRK